MNIILASTSPRRQELLTLLRIPFVTMAPPYVEKIPVHSVAVDLVKQLAEEKARSCSLQFPDAMVLGSDTMLSVDGDILGKPVNRVQAKEMLLRLQGRAHLVHTGLALRRESDHFQVVECETATVYMRQLDDPHVEAYVQHGEWVGKAGGYAIQGEAGQFIEKIEGDFTTVVGLPLRLVAKVLQQANISVAVDIDQLYRLKPYPNWARFAGERL